MARIKIAKLNVTHAVDKLWHHRLLPAQALAVLNSQWVVIRNRRGRAATHLLIGRDEQGRCLTMPIVPTDDPLTWRVITGWYGKPSEAAIPRRRRAIMEQPIRYEPPREPFNADEIERMDPDNWDWDNPIEGVTVGEPKILLTLEFASDEIKALDALVAAAHSQGLSTEEFIKRVAFDAVHATRA